ncbi:MAG: restriction endonuclease subunit S, partial [Candidatus Cloacimonadota bacterium]|nr:restriction endonuclease subunit S [Candidatus Cloacimonadota bacterium]
VKTLGEVCEKIFAGGDKPKEFSKFMTDELLVPIFANGEKNKGLYGYTNVARISKPSITISGRGTIGYSEIRTEPFVPIVRLITLLPNEEKVDINFLHYGLKNIDFSNSGSSIPQLTVPMVKGYSIPYPKSIPEQQRIVEILDKAFAAIDTAKQNAERNLRNAKEVFESYLQNVFENKGDDWEGKRLGDVVSEMMTGPFGSMLHKSDYVKSGIPVINPQNIINSRIIPLQKTMISKDTFKRLEKYALRENDIVIARRGEMGRCAIVKKKSIGWLCGTGSLVIRVDKQKTDETYLTFYLSSSKIKMQLENSSIGATMSNLNQKVLSELHLALPSIKKQKVAIKNIKTLSGKIKKLETLYQQKIDNLDELKKSILQKAFRGEL